MRSAEFDRIRAAGSEEGAARILGLEDVDEPMAEFDHPRIGRAAKRRIVGQLGELFGDRLFDRVIGIAEIDVPEAADRVDNALAVDVGYVAAFA